MGEFNSGKSTVINAILGKRYLKDGVVPTTNEITFLRYSETGANEQQLCEMHPDGQYVCYLPAPILKNMIIVDTPGTNVILQRQQRLTEEFVPRADLVLFVLSADRPFTESEVSFLRYTQQWKKKVVFVLNKADIYQNTDELEEALSFIKENASKLLNAETVALYPVSARSALEAKLSTSSIIGKNYAEKLVVDSDWTVSSFFELESYLFSFLDGSTSTGIERIKLKLGTPLGIAEQLLSACHKLTTEELQKAQMDSLFVNELLTGIEEYTWKMRTDSISWQRKLLSLINTTQERISKLVESTLRMSNIDVATSYLFKGEKSTFMPVTSIVRNDIIDPAVSEAKNVVSEYITWLQSSNAREAKSYTESFAKKWPLLVESLSQPQSGLEEVSESSIQVLRDFNAAAASKLFEQEIRELFLGAIGGLGAAGLSASLLTSVLQNTSEDLLALGLCSAGGYLAVSKFPARRAQLVEKVRRTADGLGRELEEAMQKDVMEAISNMEKYVNLVGKPYEEVMQSKVDRISDTLDELTEMQNKVKSLQREIQNLHVFR